MSVDIRNLPEGFNTPSEYENIRFALTETQLSMDTRPVIEFVQKYSSIFQRVEIKYIKPEEMRLIKSWCNHFIEFLQILTNRSQLISVKFLDLSYCFKDIDTVTYAAICRKIVDFLGSQHRLKLVEFRVCSFGFHEGLQILRKITGNNLESITQLVLLDFICFQHMDKEQISISIQNLPSIVDFPNLTTLKIDYSLIFEKMITLRSTAIQTARNRQTLVLSNIVLHYSNKKTPIEDLGGLTASNWRFLKKLCSELEVELIFYTNSPSRREMEFLIVPNMPIAELTYLCDDPDMEMDTGVLFDHLLETKTNDHLVSLSLDCHLPMRASSLPPFFLACKKLKSLFISSDYPANGVELLMRSWLERRPESLEKVTIEIWYSEGRGGNYANLMRLASDLRLSGLNAEFESYL